MTVDHFLIACLCASLALLWLAHLAAVDTREPWQVEADAYAMRVPTGDDWGR